MLICHLQYGCGSVIAEMVHDVVLRQVTRPHLRRRLMPRVPAPVRPPAVKFKLRALH